MTIKKIEAKAESILVLASHQNFWGKRLRTKQIEICADIIKELDIKSTENGELCDWIESNRPAPVAKTKAAKIAAEPVEQTFEGSSQSRDKDLAVLPFGKYIISSCSNNTTPHATLKTLENMAATLEAELILMPIKYVKPMQIEQRANYSYAPEFLKHMRKDGDGNILTDDVWLGGFGLVKLANTAAIIPTQKMPINNAATLNKGESMTLVASPKRQMKSLPRGKDAPFKWAYSTQSVSNMFYTNTGAGNLAEASHSYGAVLITVNTDGTIEHCPLVANEQGEVTLNGTVYTSSLLAFRPAPQPKVVLGDLHCEKMCSDSWSRTINWLTQLQPTDIAVHDSLDFMSRNHHNRGSGRFLYTMGNRAVLDDLQDMIDHLNELAAIAPVFVVESNHDLALDTWLDCPKYNADQDHVNAKTYYALKLAILDMIDDGDDLTKIDLACQKLVEKLERPLSDNVRFGRIDETELWHGVQVDMHGHVGLSGARGSAATFGKVGLTCVTGHTHSPYQDGDCVVVGVTGSLSMGYNKGLTAWDRANAVINQDGTVQLVPLYKIGEFQY